MGLTQDEYKKLIDWLEVYVDDTSISGRVVWSAITNTAPILANATTEDALPA